MDHLTEYCFSVPDVSAEDLIDELEDVLDEEFNTICEDNSPNGKFYIEYKVVFEKIMSKIKLL